jgi:hypothetical protein
MNHTPTVPEGGHAHRGGHGLRPLPPFGVGSRHRTQGDAKRLRGWRWTMGDDAWPRRHAVTGDEVAAAAAAVRVSAAAAQVPGRMPAVYLGHGAPWPR